MENQVNTTEQNIPQVGQNLVSQPAPILDKPKTNLVAIIVVAIVCSLVFGFGGYFLGKQSSNPQYVNNEVQTNPTATPYLNNPTNVPTTQTSTLPTASSNKESCKSVNLGISFVLPNSNWTCEIDNMGKDEKGWDGWIKLITSVFAVDIGSLGRGPYCSVRTDNTDNQCRITESFLDGKNFTLSKFSYGNITKELFGGFTMYPKPRPWIAVKYKDMENRELTSIEKNELIKLLDSIQIIN